MRLALNEKQNAQLVSQARQLGAEPEQVIQAMASTGLLLLWLSQKNSPSKEAGEGQ